VLAAVFNASAAHPLAWVYVVLFIAGLVTAALTAFYTFRAYFLTFWGEEKIPPEAGGHAHESPPVMTVPLLILAVVGVGIGLVVGPLTGWITFLAGTPGWPHLEEHATNWIVMLGSVVFALGGIAAAWWLYVREPGLPRRLVLSSQGLYQLSLNKFFLDEVDDLAVVKPLAGFAEFCGIIDYVLDQVVN